ncbi:hypothetical protein [Proteiniphilum sp. X52]|uniref:hypothetical protein n=1 Tax=Proteiniphilum sp. X52 TaxID=2382159 RepID=UPI001C888805|nr:hypothetical protein [Proteiniphilum sp. X52]
MKTCKIISILVLLTMAFSCSETYVMQQASEPSYVVYPGVFEVKQTGGKFVTGQISKTALEGGEYKIIAFPNALQLKSYYVKADAQGNISLEYKLEKSFDVTSGHDGVIIGVMQITTLKHNRILNVPVGYLP